MSFSKFAKLIFARFNLLSVNELFTTSVDNNLLYEKYLEVFPKGSNPIYKTRTEHDCSCCKQVIRNIGNAVAIIDGKIQTVWDVVGAESPYKEVAEAMSAYVRSFPIDNLFRVSDHKFGAQHTRQLLDNGTVKTWDHFHADIAARHFTQDVDKVRGDFRTAVQVYTRGLEELKQSAITDVMELIANNGLYRGEEHLPNLSLFRATQKGYKDLTSAEQRHNFVWATACNLTVSRFRNTVIGTLIQDLSNDVPMEDAVRMFESKVAPTNYKRPTALIGPAMVKAALAKITELGLDDALQRRFAKLSDVSVNNVLWVDNTVQAKMKDGIENLLMAATSSKAKETKAEEISIQDFMDKVLPNAMSIEMLVKGTHTNNFMSLTAPVHPDSGKLFKWGNDFGWSYNGNITDSIKEKVKAAGGNVTNAKLRVSLAWFNRDDLDIHVTEPSGNVICFHNRNNKLDVDMNIGTSGSAFSATSPVENVSWVTVMDGTYQVKANQYSRRDTDNLGCVIEVESGGQVVQLSYPKAVGPQQHIATLKVVNGLVVEITPGKDVTGGGISQEVWGVSTEKFTKVDTVMYSPNYWDENATGNKHVFFMLEGCKNDMPTRGIYNEFLNPELEEHRKVFEVLGDKTKCPPADDQLSGLGFSSTRGDTVTLKVIGAKTRKTFNVTF